jgi:surface carbohydrate biosynthesis protein
MAEKPLLLIPVENQVRELDPKLLLACIAARRGFVCIIGSHREIDFRIASFPRGLYLNKSMTDRNLKMFQIMQRLGHDILTWDEEALVHLPPEIYYSRRLSPVAIRYVSHLFAWGDDNAELWRRYPYLPQGIPIHVTGNPRNDMLRPELRGFYKQEIRSIRDRYGDFALINTNFNHVNAFFPAQNLFKPAKGSGEPQEVGKAGVGMPRFYAEGLRAHKQAVFEAFQRMIPELARAFPQLALVVRPHPTESPEAYYRIASTHHRVHVANDGNVVPWLLAARALVHNGCTTGVEAHVMRVPAISYRPVVNEDYDSGFYILPNRLSHPCFSFEGLCAMLQTVLDGGLGPAEGAERQALVQRHLAALNGPLASERIVTAVEEILRKRPGPQRISWADRAAGSALARGRSWVNTLMASFSNSRAPSEFHRHRYPGISLADIRDRIVRFQALLSDTSAIRVEQHSDQIFRISG